MPAAGETTLRRSLLCANFINAPCFPSFVPVWCRHTINRLHKPLLWGGPEKNGWHVQSSTLPFSLSPDAYDFHQECFIWILYYMCCPKVLKGSFNMWILCSAECETSTRRTKKCWHLWAQMHFSALLVVRWSIEDGISKDEVRCCFFYSGKEGIFNNCIHAQPVMSFSCKARKSFSWMNMFYSNQATLTSLGTGGSLCLSERSFVDFEKASDGGHQRNLAAGTKELHCFACVPQLKGIYTAPKFFPGLKPISINW